MDNLCYCNPIDWFKGKNRKIPYESWENRWFPVKIFPQLIH